MEEVRLQKYLANNGVCSRRKAEEYILAGQVKVNGKKITELGTKIIVGKDEVIYNGKKIVNNLHDKVYILLNKPIGYVTTLKDEFERDSIIDLVKVKEKVLPVGRLDMYTSGAIILSNDGDFIFKVTHPKHEIDKTYNVTIRGNLSDEEIEKLENGIEIEDYITKKAEVKVIKIDKDKKTTKFEITIHEGKNRQVRKMCEAIEKTVVLLHRSRIGNVNVKDLKLGTWRYLKAKEVESILEYKKQKKK